MNDSHHTDQALFKGIADAVPGMLYIIELTGMKMVYANQKVLDLFGRTLEELSAMGPSLFDHVVYPPDRTRFDAHIVELLTSPVGHVAELSFRLLNHKGEPTWLRTRRTIFQWDNEGNPTHVISVSQDISAEIQLQEVNERIALERKRLKEEKELEVIRAVLSKQEEERDRIAESLHNGLGQLLYGAKLGLLALEPEPEQAFREKKTYALELLDESIIQTRRISHQLMPIVLNDFGLKAAIEDTYRKMNTDVNFSLQMTAGKKIAPQYIELAVFRIVQELVLNVGKHAAAKNCQIKVNIAEKHVNIHVSDDGKGMTNAQHSDGVGLRAIRDKVSLLKGQMDIYSQPGDTAISINIPYRSSPN